MFHSIRWRLVASYVFLTLLTVSLVGVLALSLIKRYVGQQEQDYLTANAEAVARQALPLMQSAAHRAELNELVHTAAFLGNVQVRILDEDHRVLANSGRSTSADGLVWILTSIGDSHAPGMPEGVSIMVLPHVQVPLGTSLDEPWFAFEQLPPGTEFTVVRRVEGPWGNRFTFGARQKREVTARFPTTDVLTLREFLQDEDDDATRAAFRPERTVIIPVGEADGPLGYVELSRGPGFGAQALATARQAFVLAGGGATLLAVIVGLLVSRGLTAPLRALTTAAGRMSGGDLSIRAPVRGKDEIGQLARQFNQMAERLGASFADLAAERDSLRHFIADASHGLRTPITALKNFNELLQGPAADDPEVRTEFLVESQAQLERLEWITHNLLDLSRLDAGLIALNMSVHDAGELIRAAAAAFKTLAREKDVALLIKEPPSALKVSCDRARIELALSNLLDNGIKFTPIGGQVEIGAEQVGQTVQLWVRDTGVGIDPADLPHVFERFYRGKDAREEGRGLGLAIVRSIVQAHGGRTTVESEPGVGSRFVVDLPLGDEI
jgi:signal transduction histidine kinase